MLSRRKLTDAVVRTVQAGIGNPVGDADHPEEQWGWSGTPGDPGSRFTPFSIITPGSASNISGPISDTHADWQLHYSVSSFGASRQQCEWIADHARSAMMSLRDKQIDGLDGTYKILQVRVVSVGTVMKSENLEPHTMGQSDMFSVWLSKEL